MFQVPGFDTSYSFKKVPKTGDLNTERLREICRSDLLLPSELLISFRARILKKERRKRASPACFCIAFLPQTRSHTTVSI